MKEMTKEGKKLQVMERINWKKIKEKNYLQIRKTGKIGDRKKNIW